MGTFNVLEAVQRTPIGAGARRHHDRQGLPQRQPGRRLRRGRRPRRPRPLQRLEGDGRPAHAVLGQQLRRPAHGDRARRQRHRRRRRQQGPAAARPAARLRRGPARRDPLPGRRAPLAARPRLPQRLPRSHRRPPRRQQAGGEWNFGPGPESFVTVGADRRPRRRAVGRRRLVDARPAASTRTRPSCSPSTPAEARTELGWTDRLPYGDAVAWTVEWAKGRPRRPEIARDLCEDAAHSAFAGGRTPQVTPRSASCSTEALGPSTGCHWRPPRDQTVPESVRASLALLTQRDRALFLLASVSP